VRLGQAIDEVREREAQLAALLHSVGELLAAQSCDEHLARLRPFAARYGVTLDGAAADGATVDAATVRDLYLAAQESELAWVMLLEAARTAHDAELLDVATACHEEADGCGQWLRTRLTAGSTPVPATGRAAPGAARRLPDR
jgi:hypothetical protein